jgi:O-methyltransferase domain
MDPHEHVMRLALGHVAARAVYALAHYRIPDRLAAAPSSAAELARATGAHEASLLRLLRASTAMGLMTEEEGRKFALTEAGAALRSDAPRHAANVAAAMGGAPMWQAFGEFIRSVETGEPSFAGPPPFGQMSPEAARAVGNTMLAFYGSEPAAIVEAYDFAEIGTLIDVGGSTGNLLATILAANPHVRGIVFDLPAVEAHARRLFEERSVSSRCEFIGGSFFEGVPSGGDAYVLSHVINDWPEEKCLSILRNVRKAMSAHARLLVIEQVITSGHDSDQAKFLDLISLTITGGRHRTEEEHAELMARAGLRLVRAVATSQPVSILEGRPV